MTLTQDQDCIDTVAAEWVARRGAGPLSAVEQRELSAWLHADPRHQVAFEEARLAWCLLGQLAEVGDLSDLHPSLPKSIRGRARPFRRGRMLSRIAAAAACLLMLVGGAAFWLVDPVLLLRADYRTAPGERRLIVLDDGSEIDLGPDSAIAIKYSDHQRRVELLAGQAYFSVAPLSDNGFRPFIVAAASGTARALGTQYMVSCLPTAVAVTVIEHDVEVVRTAADGHQERVVLGIGQSVHYDDSGLSFPEEVNLAQATAWRRDRLIFDQVPLAEVVAELNRYRHGKILITDSQLAERLVSGVFHVQDPEAVLATIVRDLHVRTLSLPPFVTLLY